MTNKKCFKPTPSNLDSLFTDLVCKVTDGVDKSHSIGLTIKSPSLDYPIVLPYTRLHAFKGSDILMAIEPVLNSNEDFAIDSRLSIELAHVEIPEGRGLDEPQNRPRTFD